MVLQAISILMFELKWLKTVLNTSVTFVIVISLMSVIMAGEGNRNFGLIHMNCIDRVFTWLLALHLVVSFL